MILVVGSTGTLGGRITKTLLAQSKEVRILVRDPSASADMAAMGLATSADSLIAAGAIPIVGDLTDRVSLEAACHGIDTVISTATATKRDGDIESADLNGTLNLIAAAVDAGVRHMIYTSVYGSAIGHPAPLFHIKATCEQALVESGMAWSILQPGIFPEVWAGMVIGMPLQAGEAVTLIGEANHRHSFISEADVAAFAVASVEHALAQNARLELGGPSVSWQEVVDETGAVMGLPLSVNYLPSGSAVPLLPPMASDILAGWETYETYIDMGDLPSEMGVKLTPLSTVMQQMFGAQKRSE